MKQVFVSELFPGKTFESEEACLEAEKEHEQKLALEKAKKEERKQRAEEVELAFKDADEAYKVAKEKLSEFIRDYGNYHKTYTGTLPAKSLYDLFFGDNFFKFF